MDDRVFDSMTRAVARGTSRRGLLRGLASAIALVVAGRRVLGAAAQTGYLGPGDPCSDSSQCGDTKYSQMSCDDNGTAGDGSLNCCTYEYGYCYGDDGCCGSLVCLEGSCGNPDLAVLPLGSQCFAASQCSGGGAVDCADNGGFVPSCCLVGGQYCSEDIDCCMPNNCVGNVCQ